MLEMTFGFTGADNSVLHSLTDNYSCLPLHMLFSFLLSFFPLFSFLLSPLSIIPTPFRFFPSFLPTVLSFSSSSHSCFFFLASSPFSSLIVCLRFVPLFLVSLTRKRGEITLLSPLSSLLFSLSPSLPPSLLFHLPP